MFKKRRETPTSKFYDSLITKITLCKTKPSNLGEIIASALITKLKLVSLSINDTN